jgi:YaiO family outer membrane protein
MKFPLLVLFSFCILFAGAQQSNLVLQGAPPDIYIEHTINKPETFLSLARLYNLAPQTIAKYNSLYIGSDLNVGQKINIPLTTNLEKEGRVGTYEILIPVYYLSKGETLSALTSTYKVAPELIKEWNTLQGETLPLNQQIIIGHLRVKKELASYFLTNTPPKVTTRTETNIEPDKPKPVVENPKEDVDTYPDFSSDKLFEMARRAAFDEKNYPLAIHLSKSALIKSPSYSDIRVFLGRIYTWSDKDDSARQSFDYVLENSPDNTDAYVAYSDLEYWSDRYEIALQLVERGLKQNARSKDLLYRKAKILNALNRRAEASKALEELLQIDPKHADGRLLSVRLRDGISKYKIGVTYDYTYFDKQFKDPWHTASFDFSRRTNIGSVGAHLNFANRFGRDGLQYEIDAYPKLFKNIYSYVAFAYSTDVGIFPEYRGGFSLFANLPKSFEAELGFRYLHFSDDTWIYTAALGKYYKSWLFTAKTYLTPGIASLSQSYNVLARYYFGGADDFLGLAAGTGISPDDRLSSILLNDVQNLISHRASVEYRRAINKRHIFTIGSGWVNREYLPKVKGNQVEVNLAYQIRL